MCHTRVQDGSVAEPARQNMAEPLLDHYRRELRRVTKFRLYVGDEWSTIETSLSMESYLNETRFKRNAK